MPLVPVGSGVGYRLILLLEVQDGLPLLVVFGDLCRLPHILRVGDPHPSPLQRGRNNIIIVIIIIYGFIFWRHLYLKPNQTTTEFAAKK